MTNARFDHNTMTIDGTTYPVAYTIDTSGAVLVLATIEDGDRVQTARITIAPTDRYHAAALAVARPSADSIEVEYRSGPATLLSGVQRELAIALLPAPSAPPTEALTVGNLAQDDPTEGPTVADNPAPDTQAAADPAPDASDKTADIASKAARGPVPEKTFVGLTIKGKGWKIFFDPGYDRTRVIFARKPSAAVRDVVKAAGFCWSPALGSWNKKLTHKAFRSAQSLADQLRAIAG